MSSAASRNRPDSSRAHGGRGGCAPAAGFTDLLIMLREVAPAAAPSKPRESFYGERKPWQAERVASLKAGMG